MRRMKKLTAMVLILAMMFTLVLNITVFAEEYESSIAYDNKGKGQDKGNGKPDKDEPAEEAVTEESETDIEETTEEASEETDSAEGEETDEDSSEEGNGKGKEKQELKAQLEAVKDELEAQKDMVEAQKDELEEQYEEAKESGNTEAAAQLLEQINGLKSEMDELKAQMKETKEQMKAAVRGDYTEEELAQIAQIAEEIEGEDESITAMPVDSFIMRGKKVKFDVPPVIKDGSMLIPVRAISEGFGAVVEWNAEDESVTITKGDITIVITLGSNIAVVNGEEVELVAPAQRISNRTIVPIRFIAESLGLIVTWDDETDTVDIEDGTDGTTTDGTTTDGTTTDGTTTDGTTTDGTTTDGTTTDGTTTDGTTTDGTTTDGTTTDGTTTDGTTTDGTTTDSTTDTNTGSDTDTTGQ
ncbi:MAG: stalk domain-containing protein [Bacillota bacterium]